LSPRVTSPYLHLQLELIATPVPDLAATLTTQIDAVASSETIEEGTNLPHREEDPLTRQRGDDNLWRERHNSLEALRDLHAAMSRRISIRREDEGTSYANRVPQRQSLYDWAPGSDDEDLYYELLSRANIPTFAQSARPQSRSRHLNMDSPRRSHMRSRIRPRDDNASRSPTWAEAAGPDSSISAASLLQSVDHHRRFNARARSALQSYVLDRDARDNDSTPSASTLARLHRAEQQTLAFPHQAMRDLSSQADLRNAYRQLFLENSSLTRLKNSIRYLSKLRHCDSLEEGLTLATELAIDDACMAVPRALSERFSKLSDLVIDTSTLPAVAECSWLTPGTVFVGSQHTSHDHPPVTLRHNRDRDRHHQSWHDRHHQDPVLALHDRQRRSSHARIGTYRDRLPVPDASMIVQHSSLITSNITSSHQVSQRSPPSHGLLPSDHWPVTITLHDIDHQTQTLSGTMFAAHMTDKISTQSSTSHISQGSSMRSFFEGEIIDFKTHSLQTENFCTGRDGGDGCGGVSVDARYWRGVGPFRELLEKEKAKRKDELGNGGVKGGRSLATHGGRHRHGHGDALHGPGHAGFGEWQWQMDEDDGEGEDEDANDDEDEEEEDDDDDDDDEEEEEEEEDPARIHMADSDAVEDALGGEDIIASHLRSRSWIENVLLKDWVLMRWKERCFIKTPGTTTTAAAASSHAQPPPPPSAAHPPGPTSGINRTAAEPPGDPSTWGLTIAGFYYVALRRQTGEIDGLYFDPGSLPFQMLSLGPEGRNAMSVDGGGGRGQAARRPALGIKGKWPALGFR
jgi:Vacuolar import and degradation protein